MFKRFATGAFLAMVAASGALAAPVEDPREPINLPDNIKETFRAEMRRDIVLLDGIVTALAEGNFKAAADIADINMSLGHKLWEAMAADGASIEEILAAREEARKAGELGQGKHGMGRFMPDHFRSMGQVMHGAAEDFAAAARAVPGSPTAADYAKVMEMLQAVTGACRSCHETFRIP